MMSETEQLHQNFLRDFTELLQKYKAEFDVVEDNPEVFFQGGQVEGQKGIRDWSYFTLPKYINPN